MNARIRHTARNVLLASTVLWAFGTPATAEPAYPVEAVPPQGAPNVLIIMTDDVGFAASSTFGGAIPTPNLDRLAANGLVYNNFHTTAICSPTRAALLTGRNHHAVGFGTVADLARGEPGYNSVIPKSAGTIAQVLSAAGYDTAMFGKNHNVPTWQSGPMGPFDQWGNGLGFKYFYGFNGGWTDQFSPQLIENDRTIEPPASGDGTEAGYVFDRDLADHAIDWLLTQHSQNPDRPFLAYYAPGTAHAPLQAPAEWIARFKGKFDSGWDAYREAALARQKKLGFVPSDTKLAPMPKGTRPWSALSPDERKVAARYMEVYAAMLAYCDAQIGRILDTLKRTGELDNTMIVFIEGDNGASGEGGAMGGVNYATRVSAAVQGGETAHALTHLDEIGGPDSLPIAPVGWASALNTPFPYYKLVASRLGGVRNGMVVSWPARIGQRGVRSQFVDVNDVMPTVLEAAGVAAPKSLGGVVQQPFDGVSFAYSFTQPKAPTRHRTQYFEVFGHAGIYHDGWMLSEPVKVEPRLDAAMPDPASPWQLYDLNHDWSQTTDVAPFHPDKVAELKALWEAEATRNHVLPLQFSNLSSMLPGTRPEPLSEPGRHVLYPTRERLPAGVFPAINNRSWSIEAVIEVPDNGGEGMLVTQGGRFSGWGLAVLDGRPTFFYRNSDRAAALVRVAAPQPLAPGGHAVTVSFVVDGPGFGRGGVLTLSVDGKPAAEGRLARTVPFAFSPEEATIGRDAGTPIVDDYRLPFAFNGRIDKIAFDLGPVQPMTKAD
ncbi:arylsulfatase [Novosphingobium mangrovi (ex Huang et al. 2023)]|uniref:Arylsulfatase n=1 Tax=Novosphingobium mangrovi (ex Huang et al. 2023) TaxID=2976432 RepID=A0ABT2I2D8_9SPHN|nr:arylsulfatase [Novosphingobium mangrovi (ex Huang et al. 2023)]MCT2398772.1 arylsulfatase [Novosphingobium mangrovi (ex Huang et al. 2023)]